MNDAMPVVAARPIVLDFKPLLRKLDDVDFFEFCQANCDWRIERTQAGEVTIMPPTKGMTGRRNFNLVGVFHAWVQTNGTGKGLIRPLVSLYPMAPNAPPISPGLHTHAGVLLRMQNVRLAHRSDREESLHLWPTDTRRMSQQSQPRVRRTTFTGFRFRDARCLGIA